MISGSETIHLAITPILFLARFQPRRIPPWKNILRLHCFPLVRSDIRLMLHAPAISGSRWRQTPVHHCPRHPSFWIRLLDRTTDHFIHGDESPTSTYSLFPILLCTDTSFVILPSAVVSEIHTLKFWKRPPYTLADQLSAGTRKKASVSRMVTAMKCWALVRDTTPGTQPGATRCKERWRSPSQIDPAQPILYTARKSGYPCLLMYT